MKQPNKKITYDLAVKELEEICISLQEGTIEIDQIKQTTQQAVKLIEFCRSYLHNIDTEVSKILQDKAPY